MYKTIVFTSLFKILLLWFFRVTTVLHLIFRNYKKPRGDIFKCNKGWLKFKDFKLLSELFLKL